MTYEEEIDAALDEDIASLTKRLRGLYAGGERLKPVTFVPRVRMEDEDDERFSETYQRMQEQKGACAKSGAAYQHHK